MDDRKQRKTKDNIKRKKDKDYRDMANKSRDERAKNYSPAMKMADEILSAIGIPVRHRYKEKLTTTKLKKQENRNNKRP